MNRVAAFSIVMLLSAHIQTAQALHQGGDDLPYSQKMSHPLDKPLNDKYGGKCFFFNLGPTGIRARIDPDSPQAFKVTYVFQDRKSPARGKVKAGDWVVGANGRRFKDPMGFHRKQGGRGWPGPPFELAGALEDSQGKDGLLKLTVWPGGREAAAKEVAIQLKPVGRFSPTFPWDCRRSEQLRKDLCDFMFDNGVAAKASWRHIQHMLALLAAGDRRAMPLVKQAAQSLGNYKADPMSGGFVTWHWGYNGLLLGEYYHQTRDRSILRTVKELNYGYEVGQDWRSGGYSHKPFPHIEDRIANNGPKGYGAMAPSGGLCMLAQSLFKANGLPYSRMAYDRTHQAFLQSAGGNADGSFAYGFAGYESLHIYLKDGARSPCKSKHGIGFICPTGMKDIGEFEVENWISLGGGKWRMEVVSDKNEIRRMWPWLFTEADRLKVYDQGHKVGNYNKQGKHRRLVVRPNKLREPTQPYQTGPGGCGHTSAVGMGALAHHIGNEGNTSWNYLGKHMATSCANSAKFIWDTHACAEMGAFFGVLGASRADGRDLRRFLDYSKTWIILSEAHNGGLVEQPFGCQRNATCSVERDRKSFTSVAILLLSLHLKNTLLTGAGGDVQAAPRAVVQTVPRVVVPETVAPSRAARKLSRERQALLDKALLATLVKLSKEGRLKELPIRLSVTKSRIWLARAEGSGTLVFKVAGGNKFAAFTFNSLTHRDRSTLAELCAVIKSDSTDAQAMAAVYMESLNRMSKAEAYYAKSNDQSRRKLEALFD